MPKKKKNPSTPLLAIKLNAGNDTNGNPRRVFVVFGSDGDIIKAIDEGYRGRGPLEEFLVSQGKKSILYGGEFATTASERRELLKQFGK